MCQTKVEGICALTGEKFHNHKWLKVKLYGPTLTPDKTKQGVCITVRKSMPDLKSDWIGNLSAVSAQVKV